MKTTVPVIAALLFALGAGSAAAVEPAVLDDCLDVSAQVRNDNGQRYDVTANFGWRCEPKLLGAALAKMTINGAPAGSPVKFDASRRFEISAFIPKQPLPIKVCITAEGQADGGTTPTVALSCDDAREIFVDLPRAFRPVLRTYAPSPSLADLN